MQNKNSNISHLLVFNSLFAIAFLFGSSQARAQACQPVDIREMAFQLQILNQPFRASDRICIPTRRNEKCVIDKADRFDPGEVMQFGADRGLCASTSEVRVPVVIAEDSQSITVANFRHARRFWLATIPKSGVENIFVETGVFSGKENLVGAGHAEIRLKMKADSPVILISQKSESYYDQTKIYDFMLSADPFTAISPEKLNPKTSRSTAISIRLISTTDRIFDQVARNEGYDRVEQVGLILNESQKSHFLQVAVKRAANFGYAHPFNLRHYNCVTVALGILDEAFPPPTPQRPFEINLTNLLRMNLVVAPLREALIARQLPLERVRSTLDAEVHGGAQSLATMMDASETPDAAKKLKEQYDQSQKR